MTCHFHACSAVTRDSMTSDVSVFWAAAVAVVRRSGIGCQGILVSALGTEPHGSRLIQRLIVISWMLLRPWQLGLGHATKAAAHAQAQGGQNKSQAQGCQGQEKGESAGEGTQTQRPRTLSVRLSQTVRQPVNMCSHRIIETTTVT